MASTLPPVAAAAGWMESLRLPMRDIYKKYTKSELTMMAWRSQETAAALDKKVSTHTPNQSNASPQASAPVNLASALLGEDGFDGLERRLGTKIMNKLENADGELDLRQLTGMEAMRFMNSFGIR